MRTVTKILALFLPFLIIVLCALIYIVIWTELSAYHCGSLNPLNPLFLCDYLMFVFYH